MYVLLYIYAYIYVIYLYTLYTLYVIRCVVNQITRNIIYIYIDVRWYDLRDEKTKLFIRKNFNVGIGENKKLINFINIFLRFIVVYGMYTYK